MHFLESLRGQSRLHFSFRSTLNPPGEFFGYHGKLFHSSTDGAALPAQPVLPLLIIPTSRLVAIQQRRSGNSEDPSHATIQHYLMILITSSSEEPRSSWALVPRLRELFLRIILCCGAFYSLFFIQWSKTGRIALTARL